MDNIDSKKRAVLGALIYSDIFSFPLTIAEVRQYAVGVFPFSESECMRILASLYPLVVQKKGLYALKGREKIIQKRVHGVSHAERKYRIAMDTVRLLMQVPTVQLIGLSGTLATGSAGKNDDIDLFIVTKQKTLFLTRLLLLMLLGLVGRRRKRGSRVANDKVCLNMFIDAREIKFTRERQDIYTAREIIQMVPLYDKNCTLQRLYKQNAWTRNFFPNAEQKKAVVTKKKLSRFEQLLEKIAAIRLLEISVGWYQRRLIANHRTTESVSSVMLAFHPHDYRQETVGKYYRRMERIERVIKLYERKTLRFDADVDKEKNIFYTA